MSKAKEKQQSQTQKTIINPSQGRWESVMPRYISSITENQWQKESLQSSQKDALFLNIENETDNRFPSQNNESQKAMECYIQRDFQNAI